VAEHGADCARAGVEPAAAGVRGSQPHDGRGARAYFVSPHFAECAGGGDRLPDADGAFDHSLRIVFELPRPGHSAADGELGVADCRRRGTDQHRAGVLVAAGVSGRGAGVVAAGAEFLGGWIEGGLGCEGGSIKVFRVTFVKPKPKLAITTEKQEHQQRGLPTCILPH
jgi:hypothetical protein